VLTPEELERFAALVAAAEREACAKGVRNGKKFFKALHQGSSESYAPKPFEQGVSNERRSNEAGA